MPLGDEWPEQRRNIIGGDARITFPVSKLLHSGGSLALREWAKELRLLATKLEGYSMSREPEHSTLFHAACDIRACGHRINKHGRVRDIVRVTR